MRKPLVLVLALTASGVLAATALAATERVKVGDNYFVRAKGVPTVTINRGDRLRFSFQGDRPHNAVGKGITLDSRSTARSRRCATVRASGTCTTRALTKRGTFTIFCAVHGQGDQSMRVRIR